MLRIFIKKYFLFTVGSVYGVKRFTAGSRNSLKDVRKSQILPDQVALLRLRQKQLCSGTTVKRLLCCGFRRTSKAMGQVYQCWWRIFREMDVFSRFKYHLFLFLYAFVTYLLTPSY
jgi:hypothetical protein